MEEPITYKITSKGGDKSIWFSMPFRLNKRFNEIEEYIYREFIEGTDRSVKFYHLCNKAVVTIEDDE